ncbi:MAG: nicotinate (nicotinamide) nucleotide adenylyltransferase [Clostridiales bacterium]|nr:nicotinate (nicotinamide) nucleotide adenylyltransferase [Clostridiales bacterium]
MKNNVQKLAIFGGSFDPPHFGHIDIVKNLEKLFDGVIVMPAYTSPFKAESDDAALRYKLCKTVFSSDKTEVSRYEIAKKGVSYSVDTAAYFKKKTAADLYWVIGSEELTRLTEWRDIDRLKTLVTFFVVPRPGFDIVPDIVKALKKRKIKLKIAKFEGLDISSTRIKIDTAFGKTNSFVPSVVSAFAKKHKLFDPYVKYVKKLYEYGLKDSRIEHTYGVAVCGAELAKLYGANVHDTVVACILHDIAKSLDCSSYADKVDFKLFPEPTRHSPVGAFIAKRALGVTDEIAHAIYAHTTGSADMSLLDEIVYLADKTEAGRNYKEVYYFRYLCKFNKDYAMCRILTEVTAYFKNKDASARDSELTVAAIEKYKQLSDGVEPPEMPRRVFDDDAVAEEKPAEKPVKKFVSTGDEIKDIAYASAQELDLHKGKNIKIIDLNGKTIVADYFVIASVTSTTAVKALMNYVEDRLTKQFGIDPNKRDINSEWIALDYGSVIIHIFTEKMREFYNIERLWADGHNIVLYGND